MYIQIQVNLCLSKYLLDVRFYPVSNHFPTKHPFSRQFPDRFENCSATLLIWFSPIFTFRRITEIPQKHRNIAIFSSPEHNVLRGSYCDRSSSVRLSVRPSVRPLTISLKIFSSKTRRPILIKLGRNVPWVKLYKNC